MALLKTEAEKLSNNDLVAGVVEEVIDREALYAIMPFTRTNGKAYVYNREGTAPTVAFIDPNEAITESAAAFDEITTNLRIIAGDVDVDKFLDATMSDTSGQMVVQIAAKAKAIARTFKQTLVTGDNTGSPKEFDGVENLYVAGQVVSDGDGTGVNGAALDLEMLDALVDLVPLGADALMMHPSAFRQYRTALRATSSGSDAYNEQLFNFGFPVPHFNGIPVILNDFIPTNDTKGTGTTCTKVYAMRLNEVDGLHGLYGGDSAGFVIENIGTVQNKDATRIRVKWYCGLALKSTKSLAVLDGVLL